MPSKSKVGLQTEWITTLRQVECTMWGAVASGGTGYCWMWKYCLRQQYHYLEVNESKWFAMTTEQSKHHPKKVAETAVPAVSNHVALACREVFWDIECYCFVPWRLDASCPCLGLPVNCDGGNFLKGRVRTDGAIVPAPGHPKEAQMVSSQSGKWI